MVVNSLNRVPALLLCLTYVHIIYIQYIRVYFSFLPKGGGGTNSNFIDTDWLNLVSVLQVHLMQE